VTLRPGADRLKISATFANGLVAGEVSDREVRAVDRTLRLGRIARIDRGSQKPKIVLGTGEELEGVIDALDQAQLDVGGTRIPVDLSRAIRIDISPVFPPERTVSYTVTVKDGAQTIAESTGTITLTDPPIRVTPVAPANNAPSFASIPGANNNTSPSNLQALRINAVRETIKLPAPVDDVVLGGGGRYLILAMSKARQLAVLDINAGRIAKFLPLPTENVRIAAGAEKLFVLLPETNTLQRWNLATMDRDLTTTLNVSNFRGMALGYASSGPLAVSTSNALMFFDTDSLKRIEMRLAPGESVTPINNLNIEGPELNASADGTAFAGRSGKHALVKVDGTTMTIAFGEIGTSNVAFPSYDGSFIFTNFSGVLFPNFQPMSKTQFRETQTIPSLSPGFFVGLKASETPSRNGVRMQKFSFDVYALTDLRPLVSFSELDELVTALDPVPGETRLPMQKRVFFAPESNMLITIPMSRDEVVLRNIDLLGEINKTGIDYLFVASMPVSRARSGQRYRYEVDVKSRSGGVQYKIEIGPSGMRIDSKGEISWDVPPTAQGPTKVVVSARDASGQEIYHTFNITVR
jgi:hypothetical protein